MIKTEMLKDRILLLLILIIFKSCGIKKEFDYQDFAILDSTHKLVDHKVEKYMLDYLARNSDFKDYNTDTGIIFINKYNEDNYSICASFVNYMRFKKNRKKYYKNFKGYIKINEVNFLLFGDIENFFQRTDKVTFENRILGDEPMFNKNNPAIIFEPNYECSIYRNNKINGSYETFNPLSIPDNNF